MSTSTLPKNIVVVGGGVQGTSVAYQIAKKAESMIKKSKNNQQQQQMPKITLLEAKATASAASGKGGGFMARSWGDGSPTQGLHHLAFDMYEQMASDLKCTTYRKLPVLSVSAGYKKGISTAAKNTQLKSLLPNWLDGEEYGRISAMGYGDDTAQITPSEFVNKMLQDQCDNINVILGSCTGVETDQGSERGNKKIVGVKYVPRSGENGGGEEEEQILPADVIVVSAGPWSCQAEDWFLGAVELPMEGIKSTSIVWKKPEGTPQVDGTALFCGEDHRFSTHCKF